KSPREVFPAAIALTAWDRSARACCRRPGVCYQAPGAVGRFRGNLDAASGCGRLTRPPPRTTLRFAPFESVPHAVTRSRGLRLADPIAKVAQCFLNLRVRKSLISGLLPKPR